MSKKEKLIKKLKTQPRDFTFNEAKTLLSLCGYIMKNLGKTSDSQVGFIKDKKVIHMHKPHPRKELHTYQVKELINKLKQEDLL